MGKTIMFTGHRPRGLGFALSETRFGMKPRNAYNRNSYSVFIDQLAEILEQKVQEDYDTFLTGGAQGMDMLAFWAVEKLKAKGLRVKR